MKFSKVVDSKIRKVKSDDGSVLAIIGPLGELLDKEIIFPVKTSGDSNQWLAIESHGAVIREFDSLADAKDYYRSLLSQKEVK